MDLQMELFETAPDEANAAASVDAADVSANSSADAYFELPRVDLPPASALPCRFMLTSLKLEGRGTPRIESLKSLVMRLAGEHEYSANDMVRLLASQSSLSSLPPAQWLVRFHDTAFSDASVARDWLPVLQKLTRVDHLHEGIVNSWGSLLGKNRGSGQWTTRWCSCCLEETQAAGRPYLHLAWSIGLVEACPVHKTQLESACHHCGAGRTATGRKTRRFAMHAPGVCGTCSHWLGTRDPRHPDATPREVAPASDHAICVARQIGTLLAKPMQADEEFGVYKVLRAAAERYFSGSMMRLSEWIGLNKSTVHGWLNGTVIPEMGRLAELAIKLRMSLRDLVTGRLDDLPGSLEVGALGLDSRERAEPRADEKREAIYAMMAANRDISIREMARELEMNHRDVYYHADSDARLHSRGRAARHLEVLTTELAAAEKAVVERFCRPTAGALDLTTRELRHVVAEMLPQKSYAVHQQIVHRALESFAR